METINICYIFLAPISSICGLFQVYGFYKLNLVKEHPEILIFWQCISQLILDIHWFTGIPYIQKHIGDIPCRLLGDFFVYFYYLSWNYTVFLSVEILIKINNPYDINYKKRTLWYHLISHALSICIFLVIAIYPNDNHGKSILGTCFVQKGTFFELIIIIPDLIHFPIATGLIFYTIYISHKAREIMNYLRYIIYVVIAFSIAWVPVGIVHGIHFYAFNINTNSIFLEISAYLGALSGTLIFSARMMQKGLLKNMIKKSFCLRVNNKILLEEFETQELQDTHSRFFTKVTVKAIMLGISEALMKSEALANYGQDHRKRVCSINIAGKITDFNVTQYNINEYDQIVNHFNLKYQDISQSLSCPSNFLDIKTYCKGISGENETFSFYTSDKKYILKTIKKPELRVLKMMAQKYTERVISSNSYLLKIFGVFEISSGGSKFRVILIENFNSLLENPLIFQLNGSRLDKKYPELESLDLVRLSFKNAYGDSEFFSTIDKLNIKEYEMNRILKILKQDTKLLQNNILVNYKLRILLQILPSNHEIIIVEESRFFKSGKYLVCIGIDFINRKFKMKTKKTKKKIRKSGHRISISRISPVAYRNRFFKLVERIFKVDN
ncbi:hypothetical protein SteCoe_14018 [Stentor coeruleus]|uniref:PIPK domain-containing protein n=1 Tax=Stentor coeruleus TaxID=5963 RepID=A0A1R2C761_9CILI|nr:hypothetical protein SteCoe_14018 [Stentor coeruleus]